MTMADKLASFRDVYELFSKGRSLATTSPVVQITDANETLFYDVGGSATYTSNPGIPMGTMIRWRLDEKDHPNIFNQDQWVAWTTGTASVVRWQEVQKSKIVNHQTDMLPDDVGYPNWIKEIVNEKIKKCLISNIY